MRRRFPKPPAGRRRFCRVALVVLLAGSLVLLGCEQGLGSLSPELTQEVARGYVQECLTKAVEEELAENEGPYIQAERDADGRVTAAFADTQALNALKTGIQGRLARALNGRAGAQVPLGSLTGIALLNGRGPGIPVRMAFEGCADLRFDTEFTTAGLNQSLHRVTLTVEARVYSQSRRFSAYVEESTSTVLAETLVVGPVPQVAVGRGG